MQISVKVSKNNIDLSKEIRWRNDKLVWNNRDMKHIKRKVEAKEWRLVVGILDKNKIEMNRFKKKDYLQCNDKDNVRFDCVLVLSCKFINLVNVC